MSGKRVSIIQKPHRPAGEADAWVQKRGAEPTKRLTVDIPASLHARVKAQCALEGVNMKSAVLNLLSERFPE